MIEVRSLTYRYPSGMTVFENFDWQVERGDSWSVLGPSGGGKTTLLYLLAGLRFPTSGSVVVDGESLSRPRPHTGLIIQEYGLLPWATVRQNATLGFNVRSFYGPDGKHAPRVAIPEDMVDHWLDRLGLLPFQNKYPHQLSGGQRQRTAIARTLALQPDLLLMDEPFSSLDAPTREGLQNLTLELKAEGSLTLIVVTHSIEEAAVLGEKILLLGEPPNRKAVVIENQGFGVPDYRRTPQYLSLCQTLRGGLESVRR